MPEPHVHEEGLHYRVIVEGLNHDDAAVSTWKDDKPEIAEQSAALHDRLADGYRAIAARLHQDQHTAEGGWTVGTLPAPADKHFTEAELCAEYESARCDAMLMSQTGRCWQPFDYTWPMDPESVQNRANVLLRFASTPHYSEAPAQCLVTVRVNPATKATDVVCLTCDEVLDTLTKEAADLVKSIPVTVYGMIHNAVANHRADKARRVPEDEPQRACAVRVWDDGVYPATCGRHIVRGRCILHGAGHPTYDIPRKATTHYDA